MMGSDRLVCASRVGSGGGVWKDFVSCLPCLPGMGERYGVAPSEGFSLPRQKKEV
jgi:hypothetical protein